MARIQVPKKGTFTCDSSTAEDAVEYLRQVSLGCLVNYNCHSYILSIIGHLGVKCLDGPDGVAVWSYPAEAGSKSRQFDGTSIGS